MGSAERRSVMKNKINVTFLNAYIELDNLCSQKFGVKHGGVTEYINRLIKARFAPGRDDVLPKLVGYRNLRNRLVHETGELSSGDQLTRDDVKWLTRFTSLVAKKKDPISVYLRKARSYLRMRGFIRVLCVIGTVAIIAAAIALYFAFR